MVKESPLEQLQTAIRLTIGEADPRSTNRDLAKRFFETEKAVIEPFQEEWVVEKLSLLMARSRPKPEPDQLSLFERSLGFEKLPKLVHLAGQKPIPRKDARISHLRKMAADLRKRKNPKLEEVVRAISVMQRYAQGSYKITWGEVVELEAKKAGKKGK